MARKFDVEWDDFSGGYYVGRSDARQPKNTWRGDDVMVAQHDQMLVPAAPVESADNWASTVLNSAGPIVMSADHLYAFDDVNANKMWEVPVLNSWGDAIPLSSYTFASDTPQGRGVFAGGYVVFPTNTSNLATYSFGGSPGYATGPALVNNLYQWGEFTMAWYSITNRLYYSAPANPLSWSSANYYDIGFPGDTIVTCAASLGTLYVGTRSAWYALTGVPGASVSIRQIAYTGATSSYSTPDYSGVVFSGGFSPNTPVAALAGSRLQPAVYASAATSAYSSADVYSAERFLVASLGISSSTFLIRTAEGSWASITKATTVGLPSDRALYADPQADLFYVTEAGLVCRQKLAVADPPLNAAATAFQSATVTLADYQANSPFRVDEVIVELSLGVTAANSPRRSVSCAVEQVSVPVEASSTTGFSTNASDTQTYLMPGMAQATNNERVTVRFRPNNAGASYTAAPRITIEGVKLRRVIMRCTET